MTEHLLDGVLGRALAFLGLALLAGPAALRLAGVTRRPRRAARGGAALAFGGVALSLGGGTYAIAESLSPEAVGRVVTGTAWGRAVLVQGLLLVPLALLAGRRAGSARRGELAIVGLAVLVLGTIGRSGHPGAGEGPGLSLAHALHTAAAVGWIAGLLWLVEAGPTVSPPEVTRFSTFALVAVGVAALSGLALAVGLGGAWPFRSAWGLALGAKLGLLAGALAIASGHRRRRLPALRAAPGAAEPRSAFGRALALETALVLTALLLAAALSQLPPPA